MIYANRVKAAGPERIRKAGLKHFTEEELKQFMDAVKRHGNRRDITMFKTLLNTGLRLQELQKLNVEQVNGRRFLTVVGKGKKERTIPLTPEMQNTFRVFIEWKGRVGENLRYRAPLFLNSQHRQRISPRGIEYRVYFYSRKAGLERSFSPHAFRHTLGFRLGKAGIGIQVIKKLLGHTDIRVSSIYVEPDMDQLINALGGKQ
jgi:integrase/recombinase XerD